MFSEKVPGTIRVLPISFGKNSENFSKFFCFAGLDGPDWVFSYTPMAHLAFLAFCSIASDGSVPVVPTVPYRGINIYRYRFS